MQGHRGETGSWIQDFAERTAVYGPVARVTNRGGSSAALPGAVTAAYEHSNGNEAGIRHAL